MIHPLWNLNDYNTLSELYTAIDYIPYDGRGTYTGAALDYVRNNMLNELVGARNGVTKVVVVLTDGKGGIVISFTNTELSFTY